MNNYYAHAAREEKIKSCSKCVQEIQDVSQTTLVPSNSITSVRRKSQILFVVNGGLPEIENTDAAQETKVDQPENARADQIMTEVN